MRKHLPLFVVAGLVLLLLGGCAAGPNPAKLGGRATKVQVDAIGTYFLKPGNSTIHSIVV